MKLRTVCAAPVVVALGGAMAIACLPMVPRAVFSYSRHPDFPRAEYLAGKLGVFQAGYARSYLVIAYRYLKGPALSAEEREQVREYWKDRESGAWDRTATDWVAKWDAMRNRIPGAAPAKRNTATAGRYGYDPRANAFFLNCAEDAYRTAYQTLEARGARFGFTNPAVRDWRDAQDTVFANCDGAASLPKPALATAPAVFQADRDYQIAAANFYAAHYAEAESQFRKIGATRPSPWSGIAPYLVVRTLARAAEQDASRRPAAEAAARAVLGNPGLVALHGMTRVLLHRMILKDRDEGYFHELARDLAGGRSGRSFREELWDYTNLFDKFSGADPWAPGLVTGKPVDAAIFTRDELSDWIFTFQRADAKAAAYALARWQERHSLPWLICALSHTRAESAAAEELIAAARQLDPENPGYEIANFYRLQLLVNGGQKAEARADLDRLLAAKAPLSSVNLFRALRMRTAPNLAEFLSFAPRMPVRMAVNDGEVPLDEDEWIRDMVKGALGKPLLDRDSVKILNERTPLRLLREAALSGDVTPYNRRDFVLSAFTRALLLDDVEDGMPLAEKLVEMGADPQKYLAAYENAQDPADRRFAGIFYVLHHPESRPYLASGIGRWGRPGFIDDFRDNWWCPVDIAVDLDARTNWSWGFAGPAREDADSPAWSAAFLTPTDRREAAGELKRLAATLSGPDYLIGETMRYARAHPRDPRIPEALHYALRSQRYSCVRAETAEAAEAAWKYLWRRYPNNVWTRKTNYPFQPENVPRAQPTSSSSAG